MCFSPDASFSAAAVLTVIGVITLRQPRARGEWLLAALPLLFAAQQLTEGVLWLILREDLGWNPLWPTRLYSLFAGVIWPLMVPLSMILMERHRFHRQLIMVPLLFGIGVAAYTLQAMVLHGVTAHIENRCILYETPAYSGAALIMAYLIATCAAFFCSSQRSMIFMGILNIAGFLAAFIFYRDYLTSIWCFFAAILSSLIYLHFTGYFRHRHNELATGGNRCIS